MAGETVITIVGNLTADPELRTIGQLLIFLQNFFKFAYAVMYSLHILASSFGRFCTRACKIYQTNSQEYEDYT